MSLPKWKIENDLCRCCHSEGTCTNLGEPRIFDGEIEVYSEMLQECFNITITPVPGELRHVTYGICENCANKVRDAVNFKQQVIECEKKFGTMYNKNCIIVSDILREVKIEMEISDAESEKEVKEEVAVAIENDCVSDNCDDDDDFFYPGGSDSYDEDKADGKLENTAKAISSSETPVPETKVQNRKKPKKNIKTKTKKAEKSKPKKKKDQSATEREDGEPKEKKKDAEPSQPTKARAKFFLPESDYTKEEGLLKCRRCQRKYKSIESLKFHVKTCHYNVPKHVCPYCSKGFVTTAPFTRHKFEAHNVDERFHCNACQKIFHMKVHLSRHINSFHMMGVKVKCDQCDFESFNEVYLKKHKYKHLTEKNFHCKFCKKSFVRKNTLDLHERIHTGDRRKICEECGQAFVQKASLNYHMSKYHPEVPF